MENISEATLYRILTETKWTNPFPPISARKSWNNLASHPLINFILEDAAEIAERPIPSLTATLYLDHGKTGRREPYQDPHVERRTRLGPLVLAECIENNGRYLEAIVDLIWAICEESTWVIPAHAHRDNYSLPNVEELGLDLYSPGTALVLAETYFLLEDRLIPVVRKRIRYECYRRITDIYLRHSDLEWLGAEGQSSNWNPACHAGVIAVALYLEDDVMIQAQVLAKALASVPSYLKGFDSDGCTAEGVGYWGGGFGSYTILSHLIECRTECQIQMLSGKHIQKICNFPVQMEMSPGHFVNFSDAEEKTVIDPWICWWLAERCSIPELKFIGRRQFEPMKNAKTLTEFHQVTRSNDLRRLTHLLRNLVWLDDGTYNWGGHLSHAFFGDHQWMVSRNTPNKPDSLVIAVKGGHNDEFHNHNDLGQFIIHVNGESIVLALGRLRYSKDSQDYASGKRYNFFEPRSASHNVPFVNTQEQKAGRKHAARVMNTEFSPEADKIILDLRDAYSNNANLQELIRTVSLTRKKTAGTVVVQDDYRFKKCAGKFQSSIHTMAKVKEIHPGYLRLIGKKTTLGLYYDYASIQLHIEIIEPHQDSLWKPPLRRICLTQNSQEGRIELRFEPE